MRWHGLLVCVALVWGLCAVRHADAQVNQNPVALAAKAVQDAEIVLKKATVDVQRKRDKVKNELKAKPEWAGVAADYTKADTDVKMMHRTVLGAVQAKPEYRELIKQREDAEKVRQAAAKGSADASAEQVSDADLAAANDAYFKASLAMKAMEKQALSNDQGLTDANSRLEASKAKLAELDAEVDEALKNDTDYQQLLQAQQTAQQGVDSAKQQLASARQSAQPQRSTPRSSSPTPRH
jgi:hypothetical protein